MVRIRPKDLCDKLITFKVIWRFFYDLFLEKIR